MGIIRSETAQISLKHSGLNFVGFRQSKSRKTFITLQCSLLSPFQPHSHGFATFVSCWSSLAFCKDRGRALRALLCVLSWELFLPAEHQARFFPELPLTVYVRTEQHLLLLMSPADCFFFPALPFLFTPANLPVIVSLLFIYLLFFFPQADPVSNFSEQLICIGKVCSKTPNTIHLWYYQTSLSAFPLRLLFLFHENLSGIL